jgi:deoxyadenosine/deoxycytidine kinase
MFSLDNIQVVYVEGNIGAGKTTLINLLEKYHYELQNEIRTQLLELPENDSISDCDVKVYFCREPVDDWNRPFDVYDFSHAETTRRESYITSMNDQNDYIDDLSDYHIQEYGDKMSYLGLFYDDETKYATPFQYHALATKTDRLLKTIQSVALGYIVRHMHRMNVVEKEKPVYHIIICERSPYTDRNVFFRHQVNTGNINPFDQYNYELIWNLIVIPTVRFMLGFIYLRTDTNICMERIVKRHTESESTISKDYLYALERLHEDTFVRYQSSYTGNYDDYICKMTSRPVVSLNIPDMQNPAYDEDTIVRDFAHSVCRLYQRKQ